MGGVELNLPMLAALDSVWKVVSRCCQLSTSERNQTNMSIRQQEIQPSGKTPDPFSVVSRTHPISCYSSRTSPERISQSLFITTHAALLIKTVTHLSGSASALHS